MSKERKALRTVRVDGLRVRELRTQAGLTQKELADRIAGVSRGYVSTIEGRHGTSMSGEAAAGLAKALRVKLDEVLQRSPDRPVAGGNAPAGIHLNSNLQISRDEMKRRALQRVEKALMDAVQAIRELGQLLDLEQSVEK